MWTFGLLAVAVVACQLMLFVPLVPAGLGCAAANRECGAMFALAGLILALPYGGAWIVGATSGSRSRPAGFLGLVFALDLLLIASCVAVPSLWRWR